MKNNLLQSLKQYGYGGRVVPAHHLHNLQERIVTNYKQGRFDEAFYQEHLVSENHRMDCGN